MKPTVLVFTRYYLPGYLAGGPIRTIANMVERLSEHFHFHVVAQDRDFGAVAPYVGVTHDTWHPVGKALVKYLPADGVTLAKIAELVRSTPHDIIYLNSFFDYRFTQQVLINRMLGRLPKRPVVLAPRGEFSEGALQFKSRKKRAFIGLVKGLGLYDQIVWQASSSLEASDIERTMCVQASERGLLRIAGNIAVAPDIADPCADGASSFEASPRRQSDCAIKVCFLSRISPKKNLDCALRVLSKVRVPTTFTIYGPIEDQAHWAVCSKIIAELPSSVEVIHAGAILPEQIHQALEQHDLFLFPTHGENFGHVIHEALRAGLPVLISDQTPWRNLEGRGAGWALPLSETESFVARVEEVFGWDAEQRRSAAQSAKNLAAIVGQDPSTVELNRRLFMVAIDEAKERLGRGKSKGNQHV